MPDEPAPGRGVVTRRAIAAIVRAATLGSYGVTDFAAGPVDRLLARLGLVTPGLRVAFDDDELTIDLDLTVSYGLPVAEVARQVDSAVRYRIQQALGRPVDELTIRVGGLVCPPGSAPETTPTSVSIRPSDLAEGGTDVA